LNNGVVAQEVVTNINNDFQLREQFKHVLKRHGLDSIKVY